VFNLNLNMKKERPQIILIRNNLRNELVGFKAKKKVVPIGNSGHIVLPKKLIGKIVTVEYIKPTEEK